MRYCRTWQDGWHLRQRRLCAEKIMWFGANMAHWLDDAKSYGFDITNNGFDWAQLVERREAYISGINHWYHGHLKDLVIDELTGSASFVDSHCIEIGGQRYTARHLPLLLAPGQLFPKYRAPSMEYRKY